MNFLFLAPNPHVSIIKEVFCRFAKLKCSLKDKVAIAEVPAKVTEELRKESEAWETKLEGELQASKETIQELEA